MRRTAAEVERTLAPLIEDLGSELVDVEFGKKSNGMNLTVCIHREGGVSLDDCERVHRAIDPVLDELDPTEGSAYTLNVSSPGLDRAFTREGDFRRNMGKEITVRFYSPWRGVKEKDGVLKGWREGFFTVEFDGEDVELPVKDAAKISLKLDF